MQGYGMATAPVYGVPMSGGMPGIVPGGQVRYAGLQGAGVPGVSPMGSPYMGLSPAGSPGLGGRPVSPGMMNPGSPSLIPASSPKTATGPDPFASLAVFK
jgi:hypothetical protein